MIRSIISIIAGYIAWMVTVWILWTVFDYGMQDVPPTGFLIFSVFPESVFGLSSGYLSAVIAKRHALKHSMILAGLFVIGGIVSLIFKMSQYPVWVPLTTIFIVAPCIAVGGYIRERQTRKIN